QMPAVANLYAEKHVDDPIAVGSLHGQVFDVGAGVGDLGSKPREQPAPVVHQQAHAGFEHAVDLRRPLDVDNLIGIHASLAQRLAIARVHEQALAAAELTDDRIAGDRAAALAVLDRHAFDAAKLQR